MMTSAIIPKVLDNQGSGMEAHMLKLTWGYYNGP